MQEIFAKNKGIRRLESQGGAFAPPHGTARRREHDPGADGIGRWKERSK